MGSTPLNQSDNEPREDPDPAAATKNSDGAGKPVGVDEPDAAPTDEAADALNETESDTQELSREEIVALISTDDEAREDAEETDRSIDVSGGTEGLYANRPHEDVLLADSADQEAAEPQAYKELAAEDEPVFETVGRHAEASAEPSAPTRSTDLIRVGLRGAGIAVLILLLAAFALSYIKNRPPIISIAEKQPAADTHRKTSPESGRRALADSVPKITPNIQPPADGLLLRLKAK